jgi:type IV pilus assembly protein PilA
MKPQREDAFTLVELMVVVAIIGLLSSVAVPNFRKYQARAKVPEAKLHLSAIYTAQSAFFADYGIYHNCLRYMGYDPSAQKSQRYFTTGFNMNVGTNGNGLSAAVFSIAVNAGMPSAECTQSGLAGDGDTMFLAGKAVGARTATGADLPVTSVGAQTDDTTMTFLAAAGGVIHQNFTSVGSAAALTINQLKIITVVRNGY